MMTDEYSEFEWLAFRYYTDELSAAEVDSFEQALAESQEAREALAVVVQATEAVRATEQAQPVAVVAGQSRVGHFLSTANLAISALAAAILLTAVGVWLLGLPNSADDLTGDVDSTEVLFAQNESVRLVSLWSDSEDTAGESEDSFDLHDDNNADDEDELAVPDWLVAAVQTSSEFGTSRSEEL